MQANRILGMCFLTWVHGLPQVRLGAAGHLHSISLLGPTFLGPVDPDPGLSNRPT